MILENYQQLGKQWVLYVGQVIFIPFFFTPEPFPLEFSPYLLASNSLLILFLLDSETYAIDLRLCLLYRVGSCMDGSYSLQYLNGFSSVLSYPTKGSGNLIIYRDSDYFSSYTNLLEGSLTGDFLKLNSFLTFQPLFLGESKA